MDKQEIAEPQRSTRKGNPTFRKGMPSPNPAGRPKGALSKFSGWKLAKLLDIWGPRVDLLAIEMMDNALDRSNKDQLGWAKLVAERIFPASKAVEVTGLSGRVMDLKIIVGSVETYSSVRTINQGPETEVVVQEIAGEPSVADEE